MAQHASRGRDGRREHPGPSPQPAPARRGPGRLVAILALVAVGLGAIALGLRSPDGPSSSGVERGQADTRAGAGESAAPTLPPSSPVRIDIAAVGIHVDVVDLGLAPDGTLEVPTEPMRAGWYSGSPTPGQPGPSVIVGHVDSVQTGPAAFYRLGEVATGARIDATRADGRVAHFEVTAVRSYAKREFPAETVYGNTTGSTLRLITCGGWNDATEEYDDNIVVFARLVEVRS